MAMDRTDRIALGGSLAAHVALIAALSWSLTQPKITPPKPEPMTVDLIADSDLVATSPDPVDEAPAQVQGEEDAPLAEDAAPPLPEPAPQPAPDLVPLPAPAAPKPPPPGPRPDPKPKAKPAPKPAPSPRPAPKPIVKPAPTPAPVKTVAKSVPKPAARPAAKPAERPAAKSGSGKSASSDRAKSTGSLASLVGAVGRSPSASKSAGAPGKSAAQIRQSITTSIGSQVRGPWNRCPVSGIDVTDLVTVVKFQLGKDGRLAGFTSVTTSGQNASNKFQVARHQECAKDAIEAASPFKGLPPDHYEYWKSYEFRFKKG